MASFLFIAIDSSNPYNPTREYISTTSSCLPKDVFVNQVAELEDEDASDIAKMVHTSANEELILVNGYFTYIMFMC